MKLRNVKDIALTEDEHMVLIPAIPIDHEFPYAMQATANGLVEVHKFLPITSISDEYQFRCSRAFWHKNQLPPPPLAGFQDLLVTAVSDIIYEEDVPVVVLVGNFDTRHARELMLQLLDDFTVHYLVKNPKIQLHRNSEFGEKNPVFRARHSAMFQPPTAKELKELCVHAYTWFNT